MKLNSADDVIFAGNDMDKVYAGNVLVWSRPVPMATVEFVDLPTGAVIAGATVPVGTTVNIDGAVTGYSFNNWTVVSGDSPSNVNAEQTTITLNNNTVLSGDWTIQQFNLIINHPANGASTQSVDYGSTVSINANVPANNTFNRWIPISGNNPDNIFASSTDITITQNTEVTISYGRDQATITFTGDSTGTLSAITANTQTTVNLNLAVAGYRFVRIQSATGDTPASLTSSTTTIFLTQNTTIAVQYEQITAYFVQVNNLPSGCFVEFSQDQNTQANKTKNEGYDNYQSQWYFDVASGPYRLNFRDINANRGFQFNNWTPVSGASAPDDFNARNTAINLSGDVVLAVNLTAIPVSLNVDSSPSNAKTFAQQTGNKGDTFNLDGTGEGGYTFSLWETKSGDEVEDPANQITTIEVNEDTLLQAHYYREPFQGDKRFIAGLQKPGGDSNWADPPAISDAKNHYGNLYDLENPTRILYAYSNEFGQWGGGGKRYFYPMYINPAGLTDPKLVRIDAEWVYYDAAHLDHAQTFNGDHWLNYEDLGALGRYGLPKAVQYGGNYNNPTIDFNAEKGHAFWTVKGPYSSTTSQGRTYVDHFMRYSVNLQAHKCATNNHLFPNNTAPSLSRTVQSHEFWPAVPRSTYVFDMDLSNGNQDLNIHLREQTFNNAPSAMGPYTFTHDKAVWKNGGYYAGSSLLRYAGSKYPNQLYPNAYYKFHINELPSGWKVKFVINDYLASWYARSFDKAENYHGKFTRYNAQWYSYKQKYEAVKKASAPRMNFMFGNGFSPDYADTGDRYELIALPRERQYLNQNYIGTNFGLGETYNWERPPTQQANGYALFDSDRYFYNPVSPYHKLTDPENLGTRATAQHGRFFNRDTIMYVYHEDSKTDGFVVPLYLDQEINYSLERTHTNPTKYAVKGNKTGNYWY